MNNILVELSTKYNYFEIYRTLFRYSISDLGLFNLNFWQTYLGTKTTKNKILFIKMIH